jgi:hypothetical protein
MIDFAAYGEYGTAVLVPIIRYFAEVVAGLAEIKAQPRTKLNEAKYDWQARRNLGGLGIRRRMNTRCGHQIRPIGRGAT